MQTLINLLAISEHKLDSRKKIIITDNYTKEMILQYQNKNSLIEDYKIMTLDQYSNLFIENRLDKALVYLFENQTYVQSRKITNIKVLEKILGNLIYLDVDEDYQSDLLQDLQIIKQELVANNLINKSFLNSKLEEYQVIVMLTKIEPYYINHFKSLNNCIIKKLKFNQQKNNIQIIKHQDIISEITDVCEQIIKLISRGIDLDNINVYLPNNEYQIIFNNIIKQYNIASDFKSSKSLYSFKETKIIIKDIENNNFDISLKKYQDFESELLSQIINLLNDYSDYQADYLSILPILISKFKDVKINLFKQVNIIKQYNPFNSFLYTNNQHLFILGVNEGSIPKIHKNNDLIDDQDRHLVGLNSSKVNNQLERDIFEKIIITYPNLSLSYSLNHLQKEVDLAIIIDQLKIKIIEKVSSDQDSIYSSSYDLIKYSKDLELFNKYKIKTADYDRYPASYLNLNKYDNQFTGIDRKQINFNVSHTSLETFFQCSYKYYLQNILFIKKQKTKSDSLIFGNLAHNVLELAMSYSGDDLTYYINQVSDHYINDLIKNEKLAVNTQYYLHKYTEVLYKLANWMIQEHNSSNYNDDIILESEYSMLLNEDFNVYLEGKVDKIMVKILNDQMFIKIYDYKTGNIDIKLEEVEFGFHMQNLIYYILFKEEYKYEEGEIKLDGFYKQKVQDKRLRNQEELVDQFNIKGYEQDNEQIIFKLNNKKIDDKQINHLEEIVGEKINLATLDIINSQFLINPKVLKTKGGKFENKSCKFCSYYEICNKTNLDYQFLKSKSEEKSEIKTTK